VLTKHILGYKHFLKIKHTKETKTETKEHSNRQNINICIRNLDTNNERERTQLNIFERKVYRRILGPDMTGKKKIGGY
jgi:hypothetical protein